MTALNPLIADAMGKGVSAKTFGVHRRTIQQGEETYLFVNNFVMPRPSVVNDGGTQLSNIELYDAAGNLVPLTYPGRWNLVGPWGTGKLALAAPGWEGVPVSVTWNNSTIMVGYQDQNMLQVADGTWCVWLQPTTSGSIEFAAGTAFPTTGLFQPLWSNVVMTNGLLVGTPTSASPWTGSGNINTEPWGNYGISPASAFQSLVSTFGWTDVSGNPLPPGTYTFKYREGDGTLSSRTVTCTLSAPSTSGPSVAPKVITLYPSSDEITDMSGSINNAIAEVSQTGGTVRLMPGRYGILSSIIPAPNVTLLGSGRDNTIIELTGVTADNRTIVYENGACPYFSIQRLGFEVDQQTGNAAQLLLQKGERQVIRDCRFGRGINVWLYSDGGEFHDNELYPDWELWFGGGVWVQNLHHRGIGSCINNVDRMAGDSNMMVNVWWDGGQQGPTVGQGWSGNTIHSLFLRTRWSNIDVAVNRSECFMQETGAFTNNLIIGARWTNCLVPMSMFGGAAAGNSFYKCSVVGPTSTGQLLGQGSEPASIAGNIWKDCAFHRVKTPIHIENSAGNNRVCGVLISGDTLWWDHEFNINPSQPWATSAALLVSDDTSSTDTIEGLMLHNIGNRAPFSGWTLAATPFSQLFNGSTTSSGVVVTQ